MSNWESKYGYSEIIKDKLYLGGEDDIDELLYGAIEARNINRAGRFVNQPTPKIDVWIDLRDIRSSNRYVYTPEGIEYIAFPFRDGELIEAKEFDLVLLLLGYLGEKEDSFTKLLKK
jgi:hypothetical protein